MTYPEPPSQAMGDAMTKKGREKTSAMVVRECIVISLGESPSLLFVLLLC